MRYMPNKKNYHEKHKSKVGCRAPFVLNVRHCKSSESPWLLQHKKTYSKLNSVTNLKNTINGNVVTLSWNPIQTPDAISSDAIGKLASSLFSNETYKNNFINSRLNYNSNNIGTLTYNIYSKGSDGTLTYITTTSNSTVDIPLPTKTTTYVVKASYTIFKSNISDGVETTVNVSLPSEVDPTTPDDNTNNNDNNEVTNN